MATTFYYLCYQNNPLCQIEPNDYRENEFKVFHNKSKSLIKITLPKRNCPPYECIFFWDKQEQKVKIIKKEWENGIVLKEELVKELYLPKIDLDWEEVK